MDAGTLCRCGFVCAVSMMCSQFVTLPDVCLCFVKDACSVVSSLLRPGAVDMWCTILLSPGCCDSSAGGSSSVKQLLAGDVYNDAIHVCSVFDIAVKHGGSVVTCG